jgi:hypothetical protein
MPNSNNDPNVTQGATPTMPQPRGTVRPYNRLRTFNDAIDYALGGFHISTKRAERLPGAPGRLWQDAADAYLAAYQAILPLMKLPDAEGFPQAKQLLHTANHLADAAAALEAAS